MDKELGGYRQAVLCFKCVRGELLIGTKSTEDLDDVTPKVLDHSVFG